jgi:hypothetical protein
MKDQRKAKKEKERSSAQGAPRFEVNPYYEQLLEMREKKPAAYKMMSMATRLSVDAYVRARDASLAQPAAKAA